MVQRRINAIANSVLASLSEETYQRLEPHLRVNGYLLGRTLYHPYEPIVEIYFPTTALLSWISLLEDGTITEIALVGNTGFTGLAALWGGRYTPNSLIVQMAGDVISIDAEIAKREFQMNSEFNRVLSRYAQALFAQMSQNVACNRHHTTEERLARWLLSVQDSVQQTEQAIAQGQATGIGYMPSRELALTQDFMAKMLGVRRSSISISAGILQQAGIIRYSRGRLAILDRKRLEEVACECYRLIKDEYARLFSD